VDSVITTLGSSELRTGFLWGGAALGVGLFAALLWSRWKRTSAPIVGLLVAAAAWWAMPATPGTPDALWQGLVMLAAAGAFYPWTRKVDLLPAVLAVPGAWWITRVAEVPGSEWVLWLLFAMIVVGAPLTASFDRQHPTFGTVLFALAVGGSFLTLPDTELILVYVGAVVPLVFLSWPKNLARLGAIGAYPAVGLLAWVIAWGGRGRETAVIGAAASLGLLVVEPAARWVSRRSLTLLDRLPKTAGEPVVAGLIDVSVVFVASRVAGPQTEPIVAGVIAVVVLAVAWGVLVAFAPRGKRR
jgi:hypothetical protein